jgi:beta-1,4-glucosyltransferase
MRKLIYRRTPIEDLYRRVVCRFPFVQPWILGIRVGQHVVRLGGFELLDCDRSTLASLLVERLVARRRTLLFFANHNFVVQCQSLGKTMAERGDVLLVNDGLAADVAAKVMTGSGFIENLNGTDFAPFFFKRYGRKLRIFLVGSSPSVVKQAAATIEEKWDSEVVGYQDGFSLWHDETAAIHAINQSRADVLLVGMGNPVQERWILSIADLIDVPLAMGVGALFEWEAGVKPRAPEWMRRHRMEWAYRVAIEPRRLAGRYTLGAAKFAMLVLFWGSRVFPGLGESLPQGPVPTEPSDLQASETLPDSPENLWGRQARQRLARRGVV